MRTKFFKEAPLGVYAFIFFISLLTAFQYRAFSFVDQQNIYLLILLLSYCLVDCLTYFRTYHHLEPYISYWAYSVAKGEKTKPCFEDLRKEVSTLRLEIELRKQSFEMALKKNDNCMNKIIELEQDKLKLQDRFNEAIETVIVLNQKNNELKQRLGASPVEKISPLEDLETWRKNLRRFQRKIGEHGFTPIEPFIVEGDPFKFSATPYYTEIKIKTYGKDEEE